MLRDYKFHIVSEPESSNEKGSYLVTFDVGTYFEHRGEYRESVFKAAAWNREARIAKAFTVGDVIYIDGTLEQWRTAHQSGVIIRISSISKERKMNSICISGNLTRDPEKRFTKDGKPITSFSLAHDNRGNVSYFDVVCFSKTAELAMEHLKKGSKVGVEGRITQDRWEQDGQKRSKIKIIANSLDFYFSKGESEDVPF